MSSLRSLAMHALRGGGLYKYQENGEVKKCQFLSFFTIKNFSENLKAGTSVFESYGVKIKEFVGTMGRYDFVVICEAPDAEAISKALLSRVSGGRFRTETLRGFTSEKMSELVQGI